MQRPFLSLESFNGSLFPMEQHLRVLAEHTEPFMSSFSPAHPVQSHVLLCSLHVPCAPGPAFMSVSSSMLRPLPLSACPRFSMSLFLPCAGRIIYLLFYILRFLTHDPISAFIRFLFACLPLHLTPSSLRIGTRSFHLWDSSAWNIQWMLNKWGMNYILWYHPHFPFLNQHVDSAKLRN